MLKLARTSLLLLTTAIFIGGFWMTVAAADAEPPSQINDVCANCHRTAPIPANHVPVASAAVTGCLNCHQAAPGEKFLVRVHERHLAMSLQCSTCHAGTPPPRAALDALLQASGAR